MQHAVTFGRMPVLVDIELAMVGALSKHDSEIGNMLAEKGKQPRSVRFFGPGHCKAFGQGFAAQKSSVLITKTIFVGWKGGT